MSSDLIFHAFAALITIASLGVIVANNPVSAAVFLVLDMFLLGGLYAALGAHFVAAIQILVYAGAIVVLFMFVIMLLNMGPERNTRRFLPSAVECFAMVALVLCFGLLSMLMAVAPAPIAMSSGAGSADVGSTFNVAATLFTQYLWPFELASILILLAVVAALVIAQKKPEQHSRVGNSDIKGGGS